jgi:hypothetical protein
MPSVAVLIALALAAIVPRVEDPWPDTIGTELPFAFAAAGGTLAGMVCSFAAREKWEWAIKIGALLGFCIGVAFYCVALVVQVASR